MRKKSIGNLEDYIVFWLLLYVFEFFTFFFWPIIAIVKKCQQIMAIKGLPQEQKSILKQIVEKQTALKSVGRRISDDEDYTRANMQSIALGTEILRMQVDRERKEKAEIKRLISEAREAGVPEKRIRMAVEDKNFLKEGVK